jgi:uncharacterized protein (DUF302 family)
MTLLTTPSPDGVKATMDRLVASIERRHLTVFSRVDHGGGARSAGLELGDEEVVSFGDPRVGTLLMQADPTLGYELPLRMLVWRRPAAAGETAGTRETARETAGETAGMGEAARAGEAMTDETKVSYRPATELAADYELAGSAEILERMDGLLAALVQEAVTPA